MVKVSNSPITHKYSIDSLRMSIDLDKLNSANIPCEFLKCDKNTGELLDDYRETMHKEYYNGHYFRVGVLKILLRGAPIEKLILQFSSKVCGDNYFSGIQKQDVIDVLNFLKANGRIDFDDVNYIFSNLYTKDTDIKIDIVLRPIERENIDEYNKQLKYLFRHEDNEFHLYSGRNKLGITAFNRPRNTILKPFIKFYDKSRELTTKSKDFFSTLLPSLRQFVQENLIYRFEFTMKDKRFFEKFGISNRIEDVLLVDNDKWAEVSAEVYNSNFGTKITKSKKHITTPNTKDLNYYQRIILCYIEDLKSYGQTDIQIKTRFLTAQDGHKTRLKAGLLFDDLFAALMLENQNPDVILETTKNKQIVEKFNQLFGFVKISPNPDAEL